MGFMSVLGIGTSLRKTKSPTEPVSDRLDRAQGFPVLPIGGLFKNHREAFPWWIPATIADIDDLRVLKHQLNRSKYILGFIEITNYLNHFVDGVEVLPPPVVTPPRPAPERSG
jgi:hypothetical protein